MSGTDLLTETFSALAHPARRAIVMRLSAGEATVKQLAEPLAMSLPAVSKHIKVLERSGLITQGRDAQFRPCRLNGEPLKEVVSWLERYRPIWEARFDQMEACLNDLSDQERDD